MNKGNVLSNENANMKVCTIEEIRELNETKQYTLLATGLLQSIITDTSLTAQAAKLWEYLYTKAVMNEKLCVKIRYKDLATAFNRTERSIKRYVEDLRESGYISIESNYHHNGQRANTFYIRFPKTSINVLQGKKNRKKSLNKSFTSSTAYDYDLTTNPRLNNSLVTALDHSSENLVASADGVASADPSHDGCLSDKTVIPNHDINVTLNNNKEKEIILNNNIVVVVDSLNLDVQKASVELTEEITKTLHPENQSCVLRETPLASTDTKQTIIERQIIQKLEATINSLYVKMGTVNKDEKINIFDKIRQLQAEVTTRNVELNRRQQEKNTFNISSVSANNFIPSTDLSTDFSQINADRPLSNSALNRIKKNVNTIISDPNDQKRICNEIIYAIRFGALRISQAGTILSVSHATNIALKLLREKRWETPMPLQKKRVPAFPQLQNNKVFQQPKHITNLLQLMNGK